MGGAGHSHFPGAGGPPKAAVREQDQNREIIKGAQVSE